MDSLSNAAPSSAAGLNEQQLLARIADLERQLVAATACSVPAPAREDGGEQCLDVDRDRFFDLSLDMLCIAGFDGYFKWLNSAWAATLGYTSGELLAAPFMSFVHPDDQNVTTTTSAQVAEGQDVIRFENRYRCKDGSYKWLEWRSFTIRDQQLIYAVARDITKRKQSEQLLQESEQRLTQFLDALPVGVFVINPQGEPFYTNQMAQHMLGKGVAPTVGKDELAEIYQAFLAGTDEPYPAERMPLVRSLYGERSAVDDMEIRHPSRTLTLEIIGAPIYHTDGSVAYGMAVFSDISERKQAQLALAERAAHEAMIAAQAATLHELSTPLLTISDTTVVLPLIGTIDSMRAQQMMEALLGGIATQHATTAIIDITGVVVVDTQVANTLLQAAQAARLLGTQVVITGIRPEVAQTLVSLGVDLGGIITRGTLQSGIAFAMAKH